MSQVLCARLFTLPPLLLIYLLEIVDDEEEEETEDELGIDFGEFVHDDY